MVSSLVLAVSAWGFSAVKGTKGTGPLLGMAALGVGIVAGFLTVQSAFRLGRATRSGYDPAAAVGPSSNLLWESVKTLWGMGMFLLKLLLGGLLWTLLVFLFDRV